ncbi:MAG TPA: chitobiase/beta-hexosaminidase C-terminal domain-containing protein [Bryobacteraceae bacterium]|nr:chitobiase/beta-hexosaminidase C-terminal domain-containing protein [Bryobacteraceae bacterium]
MSCQIMAVCCVCAMLGVAQAQVSVTTYHNDNSRSGLNSHEVVLTPANVTPDTFGLRFVQPVDGYLYAQPLYVPAVNIAGQSHNVVYVATEHDSVYAFDADNNTGANAQPLWHVSFINPPAVTTVDSNNDAGCGDLVPEIGITGTPVIDTSTGTLYVVANTKENGTFFQRLHALDIATGGEKFGGPLAIQATVPGHGAGSSGGKIAFDPLKQAQRPGLLLRQGIVYVTFASHCDIGPYHAWTFAYTASALQLAAVWVSTPNGSDGGIWQSGGAPASDSSGIYFATGNGTFDVDQGGRDWGDTILKMGSPAGGTLPVLSSFTPFNQDVMNDDDVDLGSGGPMLLPDLPAGSPHAHLLVQSGKFGNIYLVDRDAMGGYNSGTDQIVQELDGANGGIWGMPAYWNSNVYFGGQYDNLKAFSFNAGGSGLLSTSATSYSPEQFAFPGPTPSVSSNGAANGIVWAVGTDAYGSDGPAVLHAYDATNLAHELYSSTDNGPRDVPGPAVKFAAATVARGKVYLGTATRLAVYGLRPPSAATPAFSIAGGVYTTAQSVAISSSTSGAQIYYTTDGTLPTTHSKRYTAPVTVNATGTLRAIAVAAGMSPSLVSNALYTIQTSPGQGPNYLNGFVTRGLAFNGSAKLNGTRLSLTDGSGGEAASTFFKSPVNSQYFTSDFTFQLTDPVADGFTICLQNQGTAALGGSGGELGYGGSPGILSSVAVKFDLYDNAGEGINSTGIYTDGAEPFVPAIDLTPSGIDLHSGDMLRARLRYYNPFLTLEIVDTTDSTLYFSTQFTVDIPATTGGDTAYVGFTGGTGGASAIQEIVNWDHLSYAGDVAALPVFNPPGGTYSAPQSVAISDSTPGAQIYYTTDGSTPTQSSIPYTGPVTVSASQTLKAVALASGYLPSSIGTATYAIQ